MLMTKSDKELYDKLTRLASLELLCEIDDRLPFDISGGSIDDAYEAGVEDGEIHLARSLLQEYFGATYRTD